ncbi:MAG: hypothetical protein LBR94_05680 [Desulfovibrio sp.]|jgi:hypothetical protein|nr:hypothetical protein [Desulfovibrio sp.]
MLTNDAIFRELQKIRECLERLEQKAFPPEKEKGLVFSLESLVSAIERKTSESIAAGSPLFR